MLSLRMRWFFHLCAPKAISMSAISTKKAALFIYIRILVSRISAMSLLEKRKATFDIMLGNIQFPSSCSSIARPRFSCERGERCIGIRSHLHILNVGFTVRFTELRRQKEKLHGWVNTSSLARSCENGGVFTTIGGPRCRTRTIFR